MLYMLFYYTEALHLPIEVAAGCYFIASVWDGVASLLVGVLFDRYADPKHYRLALIWGAAPLGLAFVCAYSPPPFQGLGLAAWVLAGQLLFRTAYALVNVPYLAMSARICADSDDRALVAGLRMIAGTAASVIVAVGTLPLGFWLTHVEGPGVYREAAILFSLAASAILIGVGLGYRDGAIPVSTSRGSVRAALIGAWRNPAFVTLSVAMVAMIIAVTVLNKSILYYFKYTLADQASGQLTIAWMTAVSGCVLPVWMAVSRAIGVRALWFVAIALGVTWLGFFILFDFHAPLYTQAFLVLMQSTIVGLNFAVWAMVPDTIEYGQRRTGVRVEAVLYGYVALLQRVAIGLGTVLLGVSLKRAGFSSGAHQTVATLGMFRITLALIPLVFLLASALVMGLNPLRRSPGEGRAPS